MKHGMLISWAQAGALLAEADDNEQVEFFQAFVREFNTWETRRMVQAQLTEVNRRLSSDERRVLGELSYDEEGE